MSVPVVATVGTTHPLAFAGLVFSALALADDGARPVCVVAGISAQRADRVLLRIGTESAAIGAQFAALDDAGIGAVHVGALVSVEAVLAVAAGLAGLPGVPLVIDPVLASSSGERLGEIGVADALRDVLFPLATLVTPNLDEAAAFAGRPIPDVAAMEHASASFVGWGARAVLVKGGHLAGEAAVDVLVDASGVRRFTSPRVAGSLRGTGDLLAVTIAADLARRIPLDDAVKRARARVAHAIETGVPFARTRVAPVRGDVPSGDEA
jgi:hydroxymethylpyrimidine/phosphomethylpyrimidine kinase